ncbi:hypothetical protein UCRNP2_1081 [Neofusicoccum parvum UCRNP2]|uniref:DUF7924 domain-containing protein n=1 Tax=Botryosphaeria parva (strain UCR-NP2) TaxID=1287680 RepID=R1H130_BOTPV|nr:hypothetical protein UCRNP2_1081 [Neofusicoccum parvum UCRNP2]
MPAMPPSSLRSASSKHRRASSAFSSATSNRVFSVSSARYRQDVLELNGVSIHKSRDTAPPAIQCLVDDILSAPRDEAAPSPEELRRWVRAIVKAEDRGEDGVGNTLLSSISLLPPDEHHELVQRCGSLPFARPDVCLPRISGSDALTTNVPRISPPVPDVTYGLRAAAFTTQQRVVMTTIPPTSTVAQPIVELFWPFLVVGFKAQNKAGSMYTAINQCAGGGSAAVKAQKILAGQWRVDPPATHAAFSCAMDDRSAELFVHHASKDGATYHMTSINRYLLADPEHLARLHLHLHNIANWGRGGHLTAVRRLLNAQIARALPAD